MYEVLFICSKKYIYQTVKRHYVCAVPHYMKRILFKFFNPGGHCTCVLCRSVIAANGQTAVSGVFCTRSESLPSASPMGKIVKFCSILRVNIVCLRHSLQIIAPIKAVYNQELHSSGVLRSEYW